MLPLLSRAFAISVGIIVLSACGIESDGLLTIDGGGAGVSSGSAIDGSSGQNQTGGQSGASSGGTSSGATSGSGSVSGSSSGVGSGTSSGNDASDGTQGTGYDASLGGDAPSTQATDSGGSTTSVCDRCAQTTCASQVASCSSGSQCQMFRDCELACSSSSSSTCDKACQTKYSTGATAFAALAYCATTCGGALCTAQLIAGL